MSYDVVRRGDPLTEKEHEVMALMAKGATQPDAAERIGVSAHTVKFHLGRIFRSWARGTSCTLPSCGTSRIDRRQALRCFRFRGWSGRLLVTDSRRG